jgi:hypothetical protein
MGSLIYQGPNTVNQFRVYSVEYCTGTDDNNDPYVAIRFSFSRDLLGAFLTAFLPFMVRTFFLSSHTAIFEPTNPFEPVFQPARFGSWFRNRGADTMTYLENGWYYSLILTDI